MTSIRLSYLLQALLIASCAIWLMLSTRGERSSWRTVSAQMRISTSESLASVRASPASAWQQLDQAELAQWRGGYWLRFQLEQPASAPAQPWLVSLSLRGASRLYWDGELLGENGRPSEELAAESPGRVDALYPLDRARLSLNPDLAPGQHEVLVYASSHFAPSMASAGADLRVMSMVQSRQLGRRWLLIAAACGAIATALMVLTLALGTAPRLAQAERGRGWLVALGVVGLLLPMTEAWRPLVGYSYDWHGARMLMILTLHALAALLLPSYLNARFAQRPASGVWAHWLLLAWLALVLLQSLIGSFDVRSWVMQFGGIVLALAVLLRCWKTQIESRPLSALLVSMLMLALAFPEAFLDGLYFIALAVLMIYLLLRHADFLQTLRGEHARLSAERDRLSAQLLQRAIQPHWLMNTLTSLQELIEQAPELANHLVDLLAEHFALLRTHSQRESIPLADEIKLCQVQLDIAAQAGQRPIALRLVSAIPNINVPPGILHTLIENSLTHAGFSACADVGFELSIEQNDICIRLCLRAPLAGRRQVPRASDLTSNGTGTRFITASLEHMFAGRAQLCERAIGRHWQSEINIPCAY